MTVDGAAKTFWTTATSVDQALKTSQAAADREMRKGGYYK